MTWKIGHDDCESQLQLPAGSRWATTVQSKAGEDRQAAVSRPQSARKITTTARRPAEPMVAELMEQAMSDHPHEAGQTRPGAACGELGRDNVMDRPSGQPSLPAITLGTSGQETHWTNIMYTHSHTPSRSLASAEAEDFRHEQAADR